MVFVGISSFNYKSTLVCDFFYFLSENSCQHGLSCGYCFRLYSDLNIFLYKVLHPAKVPEQVYTLSTP